MSFDAVMLLGKSRRVKDKPFRLISGRMLFEYGYSTLLSCFERVYLVCAPEYETRLSEYPYVLAEDESEGPLSALSLASRRSRADYLFLSGCDMPFLSREAIQAMLSLAGRDGLVLEGEKGYEPLHSIYRREAVSSLGDLKDKPLSYLLGRLDLEYVGAEELLSPLSDPPFYQNFNTEEDLDLLSDLMSTRRGRMMC